MKSFSLENFDVYLGRNGKLIFVWYGDSFNTSIKELERIIEWVNYVNDESNKNLS